MVGGSGFYRQLIPRDFCTQRLLANLRSWFLYILHYFPILFAKNSHKRWAGAIHSYTSYRCINDTCINDTYNITAYNDFGFTNLNEISSNTEFNKCNYF